MALILAFDTATRHLEVCLVDGGSMVTSRADRGERFAHAELINVFIDEVMRESGRTLAKLDAVAVGVGPGSYTGLRIGSSTAKGLCFALGIPVIGMSTLTVLAHQLHASGTRIRSTDALMPMIDARRMEVFTAEHDAHCIARTPARPLILDEAWCVGRPEEQRTIVFGDGADKASMLWEHKERMVHVAGIAPASPGLAACASRMMAEGRFADLAYLVPDYAKEANLTRPASSTP